MVNSELFSEKFKRYHACVIIPTYNNAGILAGVIEDVAAYTHDIIVVNDGSTDHTESILLSFPFIQNAGYPKNAGKGMALQTGFAFAASRGYEFAITIDSDGQHFAKDLPTFLQKLETEKNAVIIGARNMDQSSVPGKSSFGNRFSNFWFKVETGISMPDTQSGYRLYPLRPLLQLSFFTRKYEFEIEVLVRAAWKGIKITSVPISVYYPPEGERISHFRPFRDFTRISVLNTILVLIAFLYIKPRNFFRILFNKEKCKQLIRDQLLNNRQSDHVNALSVAFGVFMGIIPIWGFQLIVGIFLAILFKLNKALFIIAANISIPPMIPVIIFLSYKAGSFWMGNEATYFSFSHNITLQSVYKNFQQYLYGSITFAVLAGALAGLLTFILIKLFKKNPVLAR